MSRRAELEKRLLALKQEIKDIVAELDCLIVSKFNNKDTQKVFELFQSAERSDRLIEGNVDVEQIANVIDFIWRHTEKEQPVYEYNECTGRNESYPAYFVHGKKSKQLLDNLLRVLEILEKKYPASARRYSHMAHRIKLSMNAIHRIPPPIDESE